MKMTKGNDRDVAVFIDFENIYISVQQIYNTNPKFENIMEKCAEYGRVIIARAYADWYRYQKVTNALYANGIEPVYVPTYRYGRDYRRHGDAIKNSADIHLVIDGMKILYTYGNIDTYVLATGDRDFIPLANAIRQHGKKVIIIGIAEAASSHLAQSADEFFFYHQLSDDIRKAEEKSQDPYEALVKAVHEARRRGNMTTFATLKLLMVEIMGEFDQAKYKDPQGRPFTKFKDFAREAVRRGMIQIFTSGTVNEVFLPHEDPYALSQMASSPTLPSSEDSPEVRDLDDLFDVLVEAIKLARRRKNACTAGTVKLLVKEMLGKFHESNYVNRHGKPFRQFKELLQEADRQGKIQLLTTGTVDELFLPDEDARKMSRFANADTDADGEEAPAASPKNAQPKSKATGRQSGKSRRKKKDDGGNAGRAGST